MARRIAVPAKHGASALLQAARSSPDDGPLPQPEQSAGDESSSTDDTPVRPEGLRMSVATQPPGTGAAQQAASRRPRTSAEAARYGVLRRLAPALKHDMVVNLQAVAMMAEVMGAKLEKGTPSPA